LPGSSWKLSRHDLIGYANPPILGSGVAFRASICCRSLSFTSSMLLKSQPSSSSTETRAAVLADNLLCRRPSMFFILDTVALSASTLMHLQRRLHSSSRRCSTPFLAVLILSYKSLSMEWQTPAKHHGGVNGPNVIRVPGRDGAALWFIVVFFGFRWWFRPRSRLRLIEDIPHGRSGQEDV